MAKKFLSREKMIGKQVIDSEGMIVGNVKDISINLEKKKIALLVVARTGAEIDIPSDDVLQVGDVILLSKEVKPPPSPEGVPPAPPAAPPAPPTAPNKCPKCGYLNAPDSKFCIKCGTKLK